MGLSLRSIAGFSLLSLALALPASEISARRADPLPLPVEIIHQFPHPTWVQDLAVRADGKVLVTLLTAPELYEIDPFGKKDATLVHTFPDHLCLTGITETTHDVFYVAGGNVTVVPAAGAATTTNFSLTGNNVPGAWDVYRIDLTHDHAPAKVSKVAHLPQALNIDGMTTLDAHAGILLLSDSLAGVVYKLNVKTGESAIVIDDPTMKSTPAIAIGIHALRIRDGSLFFDNSAQETFVRIPIHSDGTAAGAAVVLSTNINSNGFAFDSKGDAFFTENTPNALGYVPVGGGESTVLAGVPLTAPSYLPGPESCEFGRTRLDCETLYITTTGGIASGLGNLTLGGTLSKVNIGKAGYYNKGSLSL